MAHIMAKKECDNCKLCKHAKIKDSMENSWECYNYVWEDVICEHPSNSKPQEVITFSEENEEVIPPNWCPLKKNNEDKNKVTKTKIYKTPTEFSALCRNLRYSTDWNEIEIGKIYHLPPVGTEKRSDIFIIDKTQYMIRAKRISDIEKGTGYTETFYKSTDDCWRFFVENKMIDTSELEKKLMSENNQTRTYFASI